MFILTDIVKTKFLKFGGTLMENNDYREERFDSFLNKTIIFASKGYFKKQITTDTKEQTIFDDENYQQLIYELLDYKSDYENINLSLTLQDALKSLSAIEQAVIFLLFKKDLEQDEAAKILEICSKSVSRIKLRAIEKLKKYLKGDFFNE